MARVAGCVAGASSVVVGQPFDTVKVRVQTLAGAGHGSAWRVAVTTVREEGIRGLFKGMSAPLVMTGASNAIVFAAKGATLRLVHPESQPRDGFTAMKPPLWAVVLSGNVAGAPCLPQQYCSTRSLPLITIGLPGLASTAIGTPMELVKCRLQVQKGSTGGEGRTLQYARFTHTASYAVRQSLARASTCARSCQLV